MKSLHVTFKTAKVTELLDKLEDVEDDSDNIYLRAVSATEGFGL